MSEPRPPLSADEVAKLHQSCSNWRRWGERDQLGALNWITPAKRAAAAASVRTGRAVGCARTLPTEPAPDVPRPVAHHMIGTATEGWGGDYVAMAMHGYSISHIDALCHIFHEGKLYNGYSVERVTAHGAQELGIHALADGIVSRGVLLDVPRALGVAWLEPGTPIFPEDLERCETQCGVTVEEGDVLLLATGRWQHCEAAGPAPVETRGLAGLDASCLPWLFERRVAALGCDGVSDVLPSRISQAPLPIHSVAIVAMGLHLLDNLELRVLSAACAEEGRWSFLLTIAPWVLYRGTASPVNPIAMF